MNSQTKEQVVAFDLGTIIANQAIDYANLKMQIQQLQFENNKLREELMNYQRKSKGKEMNKHEPTSDHAANGQNNY